MYSGARMEPFTIATVALASAVLTKVLEKSGHSLGTRVFDESKKLVSLLRQKAGAEVGLAA
jgi:hypothetical protein